VQTLTIPMLAAPRSRVRERAGGVLSALRREKPRDTVPDGCDPAVFAAQCAEYLERAHTERDLAASAEATRVADAVVDPIEPIETIAEEWSVAEPVVTETPAQTLVVQQAETHEVIVPETPAPLSPARERVKSRAPRLPVHESAAIETVSQAIASLSQLFEEQFEESHQEQPVQEQTHVEPQLNTGMIELDISTILEDAADLVDDDAEEPEVYELAMPLETDDGAAEAEFVAALAESEKPIRIEAAESASPHSEPHAWPTIEEAYAEARRLTFGTDTVRPTPTRSTIANRGQRKGRPVQDEWGIFDPEQCGFAALIAKLDEIIENTDDVSLPGRRA
jgi:hypothetical protein